MRVSLAHGGAPLPRATGAGNSVKLLLYLWSSILSCLLSRLESVSEVFGESLQYHRQWISDDGRDWALEFTAEVGQKRMRIKGLDLITLDASGCIVKFEVQLYSIPRFQQFNFTCC